MRSSTGGVTTWNARCGEEMFYCSFYRDFYWGADQAGLSIDIACSPKLTSSASSGGDRPPPPFELRSPEPLGD